MYHDGTSVPAAQANSPPWMSTGRAMVGLREVKGPLTAPAIHAMLVKLRAWWDDDETPWCGTLVAHCIQDAGLELPQHWYRALGWSDWGRDMIARPAPYGAIVVRERQGGGHVHFYVAPVRDRPDLYWALGGNQDNMVCARAYSWKGVVAVRWPKDYPLVDYRGPDAMMAGDVKPAGSDA
jgi:uncharacterized protein (TIGR02594 family)